MSTNYGHSHAAGFTVEGTIVEDKLFDNFDVRQKQTIASGGGMMTRGMALGKITTGAATAAVKAGGANTGNGTISAVAIAQPAKLGLYTVRFTSATAFRVEDPDGYVLGDGATGQGFVDDVSFTITAGGTAFVAGDGFDITVAAGSGKWVLATAAAVDGSQVIRGILLHDVDATAADIEAVIGRRGECNPAAVTFGAGLTLANVYDACLDRGIVFRNVVGG